jgi:hypothetical protein
MLLGHGFGFAIEVGWALRIGIAIGVGIGVVMEQEVWSARRRGSGIARGVRRQRGEARRRCCCRRSAWWIERASGSSSRCWSWRCRWSRAWCGILAQVGFVTRTSASVFIQEEITRIE